MNNLLLILLFSIFQKYILAADATKENGSPGEKGDGTKSEDDSIIVNKDGLNEAENSENEYVTNKIKPPKGQEPMTLTDVAAKAKENEMDAISALVVYAKKDAIKDIPLSVLQIAEKKLDDETKTDEQQVNFGPELQGATKKKDDDDDEDDKEGDDAQGEGDKDKEPSTSEGGDSSALKSKAK